MEQNKTKTKQVEARTVRGGSEKGPDLKSQAAAAEVTAAAAAAAKQGWSPDCSNLNLGDP